MSRALRFWLAFLFAFCGVMAVWAAQKFSSSRGKLASAGALRTDTSKPLVTPASWLTEFTLTDQTGKSFGTEQLRGQVHVVNFFFASCPSVCRVENAKIQAICNLYGEKGVKFVSITCDPERDTPESLYQYSQLFNAKPEQWRFLTGDLLYTRRIGAEVFEVPVDRQTHTERLLVVDRWGKIRGRFRYDVTEETEKLKQLLDLLLLETEPSKSSETLAESFVIDEETGLPVKKSDAIKSVTKVVESSTSGDNP